MNRTRRGPLEAGGFVLLLVAAFLVRLPGIWQNLPYVFHWDEPTLVNLAVWFFTEHSLNPRYFNYPAGMPYLLALLYAVVLLGGRLFGAFPSLIEGVRAIAAGTYPRPPGGEVLYRFPTRGVPVLYVLGRMVSAISGTLAVLWSFRLGRLLGGNRAAWLAGGLLALNGFHAANSSLITTDVACGAFLTWFVLLLFEGARPWKTGIALGLSIAFKYTGGVGLYLWPLGLLLPPGEHTREDEPVVSSGATSPASSADASAASSAASSAADPVADPAAGRSGAIDRRAWNHRWLRILPWAATTFLVLNPYILLTPGAFLRGFSWEAAHMRSGTAHFGEGIAIGAAGPRVVMGALAQELGVLPLIGFAAALAWSWRTRKGGRKDRDQTMDAEDVGNRADGRLASARARSARLLALWCAVYLFQLMTWKTAYARYMLPIWPTLTVVAACGWDAVCTSILARLPRALRPAGARAGTRDPQVPPAGRTSRMAVLLGPALLVFAVIPQLIPLERSVAARLRPDPRGAMAEFVDRSLGEDAVIATEPAGPWIEPKDRQILRTDVLGRSTPEEWRRQGVRYLIATGRESYLPAGSPESLRINRERLAHEARTLWQDGSFAIFDLGIGTDPLSAARSLLEGGQAGEAVRSLQPYCREHPDDATAAALLGDACLAVRDTSAAADAYIRASRIDPKNPVSFLALGMLALEARQWDTAIAAFEQARSISPRDPITLNNLATAHLYRAQDAHRSGRREETARDLNEAALLAREAVSVRPEDPRFRQLEAKTRELSERWKIALEEGR